ncbi:peroxidasin [Lingula anatina]|uniref:Peroxidasin n=1 Tax=Lingula anatina TaxID=7574 RepID=A0A1S3H5U3_LINAN|nr:peroxidasin [Lingula anatina]|eukprot:XP_013381368.1 peroxidasin [Lingula anatina]
MKGGSVFTKFIDFTGQLQTGIFGELLKRYRQVYEPGMIFTVPDRTFEGTEPISDKIQPCYKFAPQCDPYAVYRTIDGSCNNLQTPIWGKSFVEFFRLLQAEYGDGVGSLRRDKHGNELPSARLISTALHEDISVPMHLITEFTMEFGQFLDHDYDRAPLTKILKILENGTEVTIDVKCGPDDCSTGPGELASCSPIFVPPNDSDNVTKPCFKFVRSSAAQRAGCTFGVREQTNAITAYLDQSLVYGNTDEDAKNLRDQDPSRGKLRTKPHPFNPNLKPLLPSRDDPTCREVNETVTCFLAGDIRLNEQMGLMANHHIWVREHNRLEAELHRLNPHWSGERLYQEARRINIAQWQYIVYNEYLPIIIGPDAMALHRLNPLKEGYFTGYDKNIDPGVSNMFATSAFRFGHSTVPTIRRRSDVNHRIIENHDFSTVFQNPTLLYAWQEGGVDSVMIGSFDQELEGTDRFFSKEVTLHMFAENPFAKGIGQDLAALNIQRGRDHGLPGYNSWRELCGGNRAKTFDDFLTGPKAFRLKYSGVAKLKKLYKHPDDVDSFSGGLLETPLPAASVGPTFACVIADQFLRSRSGDRFWYENKQAGFTLEQLKSIKKTSNARVSCDNLDNMQTVQPKTMLRSLEDVVRSPRFNYRHGYHVLRLFGVSKNRRVHCSQLAGIDLNLWKEKRTYH